MTMQYLYLSPHFKMFGVQFKNRNKGSSGRHRSVRTPQNIAAIQRDVQRNPSVNVRKNNAPVSKNTSNMIGSDLNLHPY